MRLFRWFRRPDPAAEFRANQAALVDAFLRAAAATGKPRGLRWVSAEAAGEPLFVREAAGEFVALLHVVVRFEPEAGSDLADVPQAREPRPVTAMFVYDLGWRTDGKAVFNLSPAQVVERSGGKFTTSGGSQNPH